MQRFMTYALIFVLLNGTSLRANDKKSKPAVDALKKEIKLLRAQEKVEVKLIEDRYKHLIARLEDPQAKEEEIRAELRKEERLVLEGIKDPTEKKLIKARFDALIQSLTADVKSRKVVIKELKAERKTLLARVKDAYVARIKVLEAEIQELEHGTQPKPKKGAAGTS